MDLFLGSLFGSHESRSLFFEEINKIDKPLTQLIKKKGERTQINKIREITTDTKEIWSFVTKYYEQIYANKLDSLYETKISTKIQTHETDLNKKETQIE